jgi:hypothetical protein
LPDPHVGAKAMQTPSIAHNSTMRWFDFAEAGGDSHRFRLDVHGSSATCTSEFMLSAMLNPLSVAFDTDSTSIAWLISSYAFAYASAAPFLGYLSDRINAAAFY